MVKSRYTDLILWISVEKSVPVLVRECSFVISFSVVPKPSKVKQTALKCPFWWLFQGSFLKYNANVLHDCLLFTNIETSCWTIQIMEWITPLVYPIYVLQCIHAILDTMSIIRKPQRFPYLRYQPGFKMPIFKIFDIETFR